MRNARLIPCLLAVVFISSSASASSAQDKAPAPPPSSSTPADRVQAQTQAIVDAFAAAVAQARGASLGKTPAVTVKNTPQLVSYQYDTSLVVVPTWEGQPEAVRAVFRRFSGGGDAEAKRFFQEFFNRFLVAHETGHWFQYRTWQGAPPDLFLLEQDANALAVAFWRTQPDGEAFLARLETLAIHAQAAVPDPTPPGEDAATYFGAHYEELGADPIKYGYYQFRFMADALKRRGQLDMTRMAARPYSGNDVLGARSGDTASGSP